MRWGEIQQPKGIIFVITMYIIPIIIWKMNPGNLFIQRVERILSLSIPGSDRSAS